MNIIFNIQGGIGKCVAATAVCEVIKKQYPESKLIVVSMYPDVFINNPNVYRSLLLTNLNYFYSDYIDGQEFKILSHDPYLETNYVKQDTHLIKVWCEMFGLTYNNEKPKIYLTQEEIKFFSAKYQSNLPILVIHTNGGAPNQVNKYSWARDIPESNIIDVINEFSKTHVIAHIKSGDQKTYPNTVPVTDSFRSIITLLMMSDKRLLIDSFAQHVCAALDLPSTVLWVANKPEVLGYELHDNIIANTETKVPDLKYSFFAKYDITGDLIQFPYNNENEIFNSNTIIESLKNQKNGKLN